MNRPLLVSRLTIVVSTSAVLAVCLVATANPVFCHRAPRCNQCRLQPYHYHQDAEYREVETVAIASVDQPRSKEPASDTSPQTKSFYVKREEISVNDVRLGRLGVRLDTKHGCRLTGILSFDGGPEAALLGANVELKVRYYLGTPQHPGSLNNMPLLCQTIHPVWVPRGRPMAVSLVPSSGDCRCMAPRQNCDGIVSPSNLTSLIGENLDQITHIEIVLAHRHDR